MYQLRRSCRLRSSRLLLLLVALTGVLAVLVPSTLSASTAQAAPAPGYTASYIPAGTSIPQSVAVNPVTDTVYLGDSAGQLIVIDGSNNSIITTITISTGGVSGIAVDSATNTVYAEVAGPEIAVINGATNSVSDTIPVPAGVAPEHGIAVDSATDLIYVPDQADNSSGSATGGGVLVIDGASDQVVNTFSSGGGDPFSVAVDETRNVLWVANETGPVIALNAATGAVVSSVTVTGGPESVAVNPVTDTVYVASEGGGGDLTVIDGSHGEIVTTVAVGATDNVAVDPATDVVFVRGVKPGTTTGGTVVIDGTTNAVVNVIGRTGFFSAVDSASESVYMTASTFFPGLWVMKPSAADAMSPLISSASSTTFTAGTAGSFIVSASALPAATFSETGQLPAGVTLSSSGALSGTPAAGTGGVYPVTITASNGIAPNYSQRFTLTIDEAPTLTAPAAETFPVGVPVSVPFQVTGFPAPTVEPITTLPAGVTLAQSPSGSWGLSGTPAPGSGGVYDAEFQAISEFGTSEPVGMVITVPLAPSFTSAAAATFGSDAPNGYQVAADCAPACPLSGGGLPRGVTLDRSGLLSGDPTAGTYDFTITASNTLGTATQDFTLTVQQSVAIGIDTGGLAAEAPQIAPGPGFFGEGGTINAAPAVAAVPTPGASTPVSPLFIATGSNGELWMWSVTAGWQPVGPSLAFCLGSPAAVVNGSTLTIACEGLNKQLYYSTTTLPASGLPSFTGPWTSLGGILSAGPAVAPVGGVMTFFAEGTNGQVFTRTTSTGYTATPWFCIGHLAAATDTSTEVTTFACQGGDHSLWTATSSGTGWSAARSLGGQLIDGPGIAAASGVTEFFVEGLDQTIWQWTPAGGWMVISPDFGTTGGVGAVALN